MRIYRILAQCFCFLRRFPHINRRITTELAKAKQEIEYSVLSMDNVALPYTLELENTPVFFFQIFMCYFLFPVE